MPVAHFRFYAELNDFLPPERRFTEFAYGFLDVATVKDRIESFGVPHTEVDLILVNGQSGDFAYRVQDGDRISVYPVFEAFDIAGLARLRPPIWTEPLWFPLVLCCPPRCPNRTRRLADTIRCFPKPCKWRAGHARQAWATRR